MLDSLFTPHRRDDGELIGWIHPVGESWEAIDLFGYPVGEPGEWLDVEEALEARGISWLADAWVLERDGAVLAVRIVEVTPERIVVKTDDFGAIDVPIELITLPWPAPVALRLRGRDDAVVSPWG